MSANSYEFFVLYDYGQGGLLARVLAESAGRIRKRFPQVQLLNLPSPTRSAEAVAVIRAAGVQAMDARPMRGWLGDS